jgi:hypothetical protein
VGKEKKAEEQQQQVALRNREGNNNAGKASFAVALSFSSRLISE